MGVEEIIDEERRRNIEARWKSDMDAKVDSLVAFAKKYEALLEILIERERSRAAMRRAVIEKTLSGLIWAGIVGILSLAWSGINSELRAASELWKSLGGK